MSQRYRKYKKNYMKNRPQEQALNHKKFLFY